MTFEKSHTGYFIAFLFVGAILGSAIGRLFAGLIPSAGIIVKNLTGPIGVNLEVISFSIKLNLSAIIGSIAGFFIFRKV